ncbi:MAG: hypothetical protein KDD69_17385 [Bdellovibrionales bacterium]|nr:hypothetical protein [Bdellovibrionales bacterium]
MSELNKNHPFRETITHETGTAVAPATTPPPLDAAGGPSKLLERATSSREPEREGTFKRPERDEVHFRKRAKLFGSALAVTAVCYLYFEISDAFREKSVRSAIEAGRESAAHSFSSDYDDYEGRDVAEARSSQGLLGRLFCGSGRRSAFCD